MKKIAFLGMGAMGSRMAAQLIAAGFDVAIWNRSPERMESLSSLGFRLAKNPQEAVNDADVIISMVRDDQASREIWLDQKLGVLGSLKEGAVGIECSTLSLPYVKELSRAFFARNCQFLDAPVAGSRPQAEEAKLIFFVGGELKVLEQVRPILSVMGQQIHHAGEAGSGAVVKLMVNSLFAVQLGSIAELLGFAGRVGIDTNTVIEIIKATPVCSPVAGVALSAMQQQLFNPAFPIDLVAKDLSLMSYSAEKVEAVAPINSAAKSIYEQARDQGFGQDNITGIYQLYWQKDS